MPLDYLPNQSGTADITIQGESNGKTVEETFTVKVNSVDEAPVGKLEIDDVTVDEDANNTVIDLRNVFTDVDNDDSAIALNVADNSNDSLVTATINDKNLTLDYLPNQSGTAQITVRGTSNDQTVDETFAVTVNPVDDLPVVKNALGNVFVKEDSNNTVIDLSNLFSDVDNEDSAIALSIFDNSNDSLVTATIEDKKLTLDYQDDQSGTAEITIQGRSNGKTVEDTLIVTVNPVDNSNTNAEWIEQLGTSGVDESKRVATDSNGNVYISGYTSGSLNGTNAGSFDAWIAKYDGQGNLLWTKQFGTSESDISSGVATDSNGNVYISGSTSGSLNGGTNAGSGDAWIAKYDTQGNLLWTEQLGSSGRDDSNGVATDSNGNVYISGFTYGSLSGTNAGSGDAWVAKYDAQGNLLWTEQLGSSKDDFSEGVATDSNANVYISGYTYGSLNGTNAGITDAWIAKYDGQGNLLWTEQFGTSSDDRSNGVATDSNANVYISGFTYSSLSGTNAGSGDAWIAKYDTQGNLLWTEQLGSSTDDRSNGVATEVVLKRKG